MHSIRKIILKQKEETMLKVQPNFTTMGLRKSNNQNQQPNYITKTNLTSKCDKVSFGRIDVPPMHSEILTDKVAALLENVIKKDNKNQKKFNKAFKESLERFKTNFAKRKSEQLGGEVSFYLIPKLGEAFNLTGKMTDGEKVFFHNDNSDFSNHSIVLIKNNTIVDKLYVKSSKINVYQEKSDYKQGDLNKKLEDSLNAILANEQPRKKAASK